MARSAARCRQLRSWRYARRSRTIGRHSAIGYPGNRIAGLVRTRAGRSRDSPALIADGAHARADGYVSLAVIASAIVVALGLGIGDPLIGLAITLVILRITWQSWRTVRGHHSH